MTEKRETMIRMFLKRQEPDATTLHAQWSVHSDLRQRTGTYAAVCMILREF